MKARFVGLLTACSVVTVLANSAAVANDMAWRLERKAGNIFLFYGTHDSEMPEFEAACLNGKLTRMVMVGPPVDAAADKLDRLTLSNGTSSITVTGAFSEYGGEAWSRLGAKEVPMMLFSPTSDQRRSILRLLAKPASAIGMVVPGFPQAVGYPPHALPLAGAAAKFRTFLESCR